MDTYIEVAKGWTLLATFYTLNGLLALIYTAWMYAPALVAAAGGGYLIYRAPETQRLWMAVVALLVTVAAFVVPAPVPILLSGMMLAGIAAIAIDRFNPDALRWRAAGALALYALAGLAYLGYSHYLASVDAAAWAAALGGQDEAQLTLSQGRSFLNTLATWGLWLILPLGYLSLLVQGVLVHPPTGTMPAETIAAVRTRD